MNSEIAVAAAVGCAVFNAFAAILQKVSSDRVAKIDSYSLSSVVRLLQQLPYMFGTVLDIASGILTLIAVNKLPLFLVQAIVASSVVMTAYCERIFLKRKLGKQIYVASIIVVVGLGCLAASAQSEHTASASTLVKWALILSPIVLLALGAFAVKLRNKPGAFLLALLSGIAFGGVSIIGRVLVYPTPIWLVLKDPLLWTMAAYGALGLYLFTAALQRTIATTANGVMLSAQTIVPLLVGIFLLGDMARDGMWALVWIGCVLVTGGCVFIASSD